MGVTYKLKEEVIDFIKHHKQLNPRISCRSLVGLIEAKFSIRVSKSSINAVIKEAHLSSPIGRPSARSANPRKFTIPPEKKIQYIDQSPNKSESEEIKNKSKSDVDVNKKSLVIKQDTPRQKRKEFSRNKEFLTKHTESNRIEEESLGNFPSASEEKYFKINFKRILMLIVLRDFFSGPFLDEFFTRNTSFSKREIAILNILFSFHPEVFNYPVIAIERENRVIWEMFGFSVPDLNEIELIIKYLQVNQFPVFEFYLEAQYFLTEVHSIRFILENEKKMTVDGRMKSVLGEHENALACPIERALANLSNFLVDREILKLYCPPEHLSHDLLEGVMTVCENPEGIKKISFIGNSGIVSEIGVTNHAKRGFILNIRDERQVLGIKKEDLCDKFEIENRSIYFRDTYQSVKDIFPMISNDKNIRFVTFYEPGTDFLRHSFTNINASNMKSDTIFAEFIEIDRKSQQEDFDNESEEFSTLKTSPSQSGLDLLISVLLTRMQRIFVRQNFFTHANKNVDLGSCDQEIRFVYSIIGEEIQLRMDNNQNSISKDLTRALNCLFSMGFGRFKISGIA